MGRYKQSGLLFHCPSHSQSTQTQLKRKGTTRNIHCCQHQQPHSSTYSEPGWGQGPVHPAAQSTRPHNTTLFCKEEPRAGCLYQHSCGTEPSAERNPSCMCSSWGHPGCTALMLLVSSALLTLQLDFTCNHQEHTALTQDCKDSSEQGIDSVTTPTTPWLALDTSSPIHDCCSASTHSTWEMCWAGQSCQQQVSGVHNSFSSLHHYPTWHAHFPHLPLPWGKPPNCSAGSLSE